jgi:RNAse (barnase) inhibitor barstar
MLYVKITIKHACHISKHSYCLANGYKLNKNYTEVLYSLWDVLFGFRHTHTF